MSKSNKKSEQTKANKTSKLIESTPKGQRQHKPRNDRNNLTISSKVDNTRDNTESVNSQSSQLSEVNETPDFSNLKKETDEILKLTDPKKYSKKEIYSNWSKYKKINDEDHLDQGADFTSLLQAPISGGGHFQFKSEKDWNMKINSKYNEYFLLDLKSINDGLLSIPFYERFEIDTNLLSSNQILSMNNQALKYQNKYKPISDSDNKLINNMIVLIDEKESTFQDEINEIPELSSETDEEEKTVDENQIKNVEVTEEVNKFIEKVRELDSEVDDLLTLKKGETESLINKTKDLTTHDKDDLLDDDAPLKKETKAKSTEVDLEQWLDDILDD